MSPPPEAPRVAQTPPTSPTHITIPRSEPRPSIIDTPARCALLCLGSLAVMAPWPLVGILLTQSLFDEPSEATLLFGGVTMFPLMILALVDLPRAALPLLIMVVWLAAAIAPGLLVRRRLASRSAIGVLFSLQAAFSIAQAAMGALLVVGKNI